MHGLLFSIGMFSKGLSKLHHHFSKKQGSRLSASVCPLSASVCRLYCAPLSVEILHLPSLHYFPSYFPRTTLRHWFNYETLCSTVFVICKNHRFIFTRSFFFQKNTRALRVAQYGGVWEERQMLFLSLYFQDISIDTQAGRCALCNGGTITQRSGS